MTKEYYLNDEPVSEFLDRIDWSFVKKVTIRKSVDGKFWAQITQHRSGRYMMHSFQYGRKSP